MNSTSLGGRERKRDGDRDMRRDYAGNNGNGQQDDRHHCGAVAQIGTNVGTEAATVTIRILTKIICIVI